MSYSLFDEIVEKHYCLFFADNFKSYITLINSYHIEKAALFALNDDYQTKSLVGVLARDI